MRYTALAAFVLTLSGAAQTLSAQNVTRAQPAPGQPAAQGPQGEIRGSVVDAENNAPISAASVAVWTKADNKLVAGAIVKNDGTFRIDGLRPGSYYLKLTMIGYATQTTPAVDITPASPRAMVGSLKLTRAAVEVAGVTATAERAVVIAPDRNSYNVKQVAPAAANASEVLDNVPSVAVDVDGKVSLRGNENVVIQINGRATPITGAQLANYLRQLPANTIERVEVVPNPSAKQDPEGMAGIINIVMKQGVDLGTSGGLTLSGSSVLDRYTVGATLGHQSGPLAFFLNYGFNNDERDVFGVNDRTSLRSGLPSHYTEQDLNSNAGNNGHNFSANGDYTFNKRDVLSGTLQLNRRTADDGSLTLFNELNGSRQVMDVYHRTRDQEQRNWMGDASLAFKHTVVPQKNELSAEVRFNHQDDLDNTLLYRQTLATSVLSEFEKDRTDAGTNNYTAQLDYTRMLGKTVKLETGYKGNSRVMDRDFNVVKDAQGNGQYVPSDLSNALNFTETTNAAYAVFSRGGKKFDVQGGLRGEYADRDFNLVTTNEKFNHTYASLFPSGIVTYKMNDKSQTKFSYSRRIRRPGTQELNPFPVFFDVQNVFIGNPNLDPEYTDAVELSYQRSGLLGTLQVTPFYRRTTNIIRVDINTADTVSNREVTTISFKNLDHGDSWGTDINTQFKLSKKISGLTGFNLFKMVTDGGSTSVLGSNAVSWFARFNLNYAMDPATTIIGNYFYRAPMNIEKGKFSAVSGANLAIRRKVYGDKAVATLRVNDIFNTNRFRVEAGDDNVLQLTTRGFNTRAAYLTVQYNWGQTPKLRQRRQDDQPQSTNPFGGN